MNALRHSNGLSTHEIAGKATATSHGPRPPRISDGLMQGLREKGSLQAHRSRLDFMNAVPTNPSRRNIQFVSMQEPGKTPTDRRTVISPASAVSSSTQAHISASHSSRVERKGTCNATTPKVTTTCQSSFRSRPGLVASSAGAEMRTLSRDGFSVLKPPMGPPILTTRRIRKPALKNPRWLYKDERAV